MIMKEIKDLIQKYNEYLTTLKENKARKTVGDNYPYQTDIESVDEYLNDLNDLLKVVIKPSDEREVIENFFTYLDELTKSEYDKNSLTGHSENFLKIIA
jgi:hypothetical protein